MTAGGIIWNDYAHRITAEVERKDGQGMFLKKKQAPNYSFYSSIIYCLRTFSIIPMKNVETACLKESPLNSINLVPS